MTAWPVADEVFNNYSTLLSTFDLLNASVRDDPSRKLLGEISNAVHAYHNTFLALLANVSQQQNLVINQLDVYGPEVDRAASDIAQNINEDFTHQNLTIRNVVSQTGVIVLVTMLLVVIVGLVFGVKISQAITRPIEEVANAAQGIAGGALNQEVTIQSSDELGILAGAFNHMTIRVREVLVAQQEALNSLQASEERYRSLFEQAPTSLWQVDFSAVKLAIDDLRTAGITDWRAYFTEHPGEIQHCASLIKVLDVNLITLDWLGCDSKVQFTAAGINRYCKAKTYQMIRELILALIEGKTVFKAESTLLSLQGDDREASMQMTIVPGYETTWDKLIISFNDITARKRMEDELIHNKEYLDNILNSMPSMVIGVDEHKRVVHWNRMATELIGTSAEQAYGRDVEELFPQFPFRKEAVAAIDEYRAQTFEKVEIHRENENRRYMNVMVFPVTRHGMQGAVIRVDEVTEQVRVEQMMIQTEKMTMVGGLAAGMAHEINNPLGTIMQLSQNIERRLSVDVPANEAAAEVAGIDLQRMRGYLEKREILEFLTSIREAGARASRIVSNMLQFSRRSELSPHQTSQVADLLDHAVELAANDYDLKKKFDFRHIDIQRDYDPTLPPVFVSPTEIEQVILNLLKNAAHALLDRITLEKSDAPPPQIILRTRREDSWAVMEVSDNGCGMIESVRKRIFEPFFTTKGVGVGTGLGLSVSYMIITNNHKGTIEVESVPGQGTIFTIYLPLIEQT